MRGAWKKIIPSLIGDFEGFEETVEEVTENIVELARQLELEVEDEDVTELLESHDQPLTDDDLLALEKQRRLFNEQESEYEDTPAQPREMTTKELEEGIALAGKMAAYWERVDPNFDRSSQVNLNLEHSIACYRELLRERKKMSMHQISLASSKTQPP